MRIPGYVTPNFITVTRLLLVPCGVYTLFKNGGDDSTWQIISWFIFFFLAIVCFSEWLRTCYFAPIRTRKYSLKKKTEGRSHEKKLKQAVTKKAK